jgi:Flp pilus assembly protein TadG
MRRSIVDTPVRLDGCVRASPARQLDAPIGWRFWRCRRGIVAVELALILPIYLLLIGGVVEIGIEFMIQIVLDHAVSVSAREIQIGNATSASAFGTDVCNAASSMVLQSCTTNLQVNVSSGSSFAALTVATVNSAGTLTPAAFSPGTAGSDILVQVAYTRPYFFKLLGTVIGSNTNTVLSTIAVQSEPY